MSPRAACRLETLGFERVFDYVEGAPVCFRLHPPATSA